MRHGSLFRSRPPGISNLQSQFFNLKSSMSPRLLSRVCGRRRGLLAGELADLEPGLVAGEVLAVGRLALEVVLLPAPLDRPRVAGAEVLEEPRPALLPGVVLGLQLRVRLD